MPRSSSRTATEAMCVSYQLYALLTLPHTFAALWFELLDAHDTHTCICTHAIDRPTVDDRVAHRPHRLHGQRGEASVCFQVNEHNRRHYPGATAAVHPTPTVSGVKFFKLVRNSVHPLDLLLQGSVMSPRIRLCVHMSHTEWICL